MKLQTLETELLNRKVEPLCPVFGTCGGCAYQHLPYEEELHIKEAGLKETLQSALSLSEGVFDPIVPSPEPYHYRSRLDISFRRLKTGEHVMGFKPAGRKHTVQIEECAIAKKAISEFLPVLKQRAIETLPKNYRIANLVVKTGDDGRIFWGGIGRHSLRMNPEDYLWTKVAGKRIYYSLDTFFQANLSILTKLIQTIRETVALDEKTLFLDLYAGVGLFGITLADSVKEVVMIEEAGTSTKLAKENRAYHRLHEKVKIRTGKVEDEFKALDTSKVDRIIAMIDPPRRGLTESACWTISDLKQERKLEGLFYLSCYPPALVRDLKMFTSRGWTVEKVIPFDFFPKTEHLETLVLLKP